MRVKGYILKEDPLERQESLIKRRSFFIFYDVPDCIKRVIENHSWSRISHYIFDLIPHVRFITMHRAFFTGGLVRSESAQIQAFTCIFNEGPAIFTRDCITAMLIPAIKVDHLFKGIFFSLNVQIHVFTS